MLLQFTSVQSVKVFGKENVFDTYVVPSITLSEIRSREGGEKVTAALTTTGIFSIVFDESVQFSEARKTAMDGICKCISSFSSKSDITSKIDNSDFVLLRDGLTTRTSIATATVNEGALPLPKEQIDSYCGRGENNNVSTSEAMEMLRDYMHHGAQTFVSRLDELIASSSSASKSTLLKTDDRKTYKSLQSVTKLATHLEHFHVYSKMQKIAGIKNTKSGNHAEKSLETHTDAGLFLSFVPAMLCNSEMDENSEDDSGFMINVDGSLRKAVFSRPETSIVIMVGAGAQNWIQNMPSELQLRATKHAVKMQEGTSRAWYGMMHLVPENAIIQEYPYQATFADMRDSMVSRSSKRSIHDSKHKLNSNEDLSVGCGFGAYDKVKGSVLIDSVSTSRQQRRQLQHVSGASDCDNSTSFYCWLSCLDIPASDSMGIDDEIVDQSLYCADHTKSAQNITEAVNTCRNLESGVSGGVMNMNCKGIWHATIDELPSMMGHNVSGHNASTHAEEQNMTEDHTGHNMEDDMEHDMDSPAYPIYSKFASLWTPWILFYLFVC